MPASAPRADASVELEARPEIEAHPRPQAHRVVRPRGQVERVAPHGAVQRFVVPQARRNAVHQFPDQRARLRGRRRMGAACREARAQVVADTEVERGRLEGGRHRPPAADASCRYHQFSDRPVQQTLDRAADGRTLGGRPRHVPSLESGRDGGQPAASRRVLPRGPEVPECILATDVRAGEPRPCGKRVSGAVAAREEADAVCGREACGPVQEHRRQAAVQHRLRCPLEACRGCVARRPE